MFSDGLKEWIREWTEEYYKDSSKLDNDIDLFDKALSLTPKTDEVAGIPELKDHLEMMSSAAQITDLKRGLNGLIKVEPFLKHLYSILYPDDYEYRRKQREADGGMLALSTLLTDAKLGMVPRNYSLADKEYKWGDEDAAFDRRRREHYDFIYDTRNEFAHEYSKLKRQEVYDITAHYLFVYLDISSRLESGIRKAYSAEVLAGSLRLTDYCAEIENEYKKQNESGFRYVDIKWRSNFSGSPQYSTVNSILEDTKHRRVKILGEAGSGKTTIMTQMEYLAARSCKRDASAPVPVFIALGNLNLDPTLNKTLYSSICERLGVEPVVLDEVLLSKQLLLLLDGFNEILDPRMQRRIAVEIDSFAKKNSRCFIYISDRSVVRSVNTALDDAVEYKLYPMDNKVKAAFIGNFCTDEEAKRILTDNINSKIIKNIGTPLRLRQLIEYVSSEKRMPENFTKEYTEFVFERELREKKDPDARNLSRFSAALALDITDKNNNEITADEATACLAKCIRVFGGDLNKVDKYLDLLLDIGILAKSENNCVKFKLDEYLDYFFEKAYYKENRESQSIDELLGGAND